MKDVLWQNPFSGETFLHRDRSDGKRDLKFGQTGSSLPGHAVFLPNGNLSYLRDTNGHVIGDDKL